MALFLRAGSHGLRYTLRAQREPCLLKLSGYAQSSQDSRCLRWYSENAMLEDSPSAASDATGEDCASSTALNSSKEGDDVGNTKSTSTTASSKQGNGPEETPTDKLTNLILTKMRAKNNASDPSLSPSNVGPPKPVKPADKSGESGRVDKWDQVMESMRNMAAKRREQVAKGSGAKPVPRKDKVIEDQDDFSDLDHPSGKLSKALDDLPSTDEAFEAYVEGTNQRESTLQSSGVKQKSKESKAVAFSFLKALGNETSTTEPQSSRSASNGSTGVISSSKSKDIGFQPPRKDAKPLSFEFLKPSDAKQEASKPSELKGSSLPGVQPMPNDAARPPFSNQNNQKRESGLLPGAAGVRARQLSFEEAKQESNNTLPGHASGHTISINNLSGDTNLALVKEALSVHGEITTCYKKPNLDGSYSALVEFKTAEAMEDAISAKWLQIDSKTLSITSAESPITTVVRLSRVNAIADNEVCSVCEKFGQIEQFRRRGSSVYDVYYKPGELINMPAILDRLNEVTLNQRRWVAIPAPLLLPSARREVLRSSEGQAWHAQQMNQTVSRLEMGIEAMSLYFEDLKALVSMEDEIAK